MVEAAKTKDGRSPADDFLQELAKRRQRIGLLAAVAVRFEDIATTGDLEVPRELNDLGDGIWEIKAERVRLPFYWSAQPCASPVIRITHGFWKGTWNTPRKEIYRARWIRDGDMKS